MPDRARSGWAASLAEEARENEGFYLILTGGAGGEFDRGDAGQ